MMMNGELDVYGRYGTRAGGGFKGPFRPYEDTLFLANKDMTAQSLKLALRGALDLHRKWSDEQTRKALHDALAGKLGATYLGRPVARPAELRSTRRGNECYHCHRVAEEEVAHYFNRRQKVPDRLLWAWPMPDELGFELDPDHCARVDKVVPESEGARAGLRVGDDIVAMAGQPILSIADVQWALDQAPDAGRIALRVRRAGSEHDLDLELPEGWRRRDAFAWRYSFNNIKAKVLGLDELRDLDQKERAAAGVKDGEGAIGIGRVLRANRRDGIAGAAHAAGVRTGDVIVAVDGQGGMRESDLLARVLQTKAPGDKVALTLLRDGARLQVEFEVQRLTEKRGHDH